MRIKFYARIIFSARVERASTNFRALGIIFLFPMQEEKMQPNHLLCGPLRIVLLIFVHPQMTRKFDTNFQFKLSFH